MATNSHAVRMALSPARTSTYLLALRDQPPFIDRALELYVWNSQLGAALMTPISVCEVVIRNAIDEALSAVHGQNWPWSLGFYWTLNLKGKDALDKAKHGQSTTGKVIAELNFGFWENMFVASFDAGLWIPHLNAVLPNLPVGQTVQQSRLIIRQELDKLRRLRNRIAHHEPLLTINALNYLQTVQQLIGYRCTETASWVGHTNNIAALLASRPL
jgi:hypothetical protein